MKGGKIVLNANKYFERMPVPEYVFIKVDQDARRGAAQRMEKGSPVKAGQPIVFYSGEYDSVLFSSVSGVIEDYVTLKDFGNKETEFVKIRTDGKQECWEGIKPPMINNRRDFLRAVESCGIRGIQGITLATCLQMNREELEGLDTLVINAAEWIEYGNAESFVIKQEAELLTDTIVLAMKHLGIGKCYIGVEAERKDAIACLQWFIKEKSLEEKINVVPLTTGCPPGSDRLLVFETTGELIDARMQPTDFNILVANILSFYVLGYYLRTGMPLITKLVSVIDREKGTSRDILTPIGAPIKDIIEYCSDDGQPPAEIILGGYDVAHLLKNHDVPLGMDNMAVMIFDKGVSEPRIPSLKLCNECGTCSDNCSAGLEPGKIYQAFMSNDISALRQLNPEACVECGRCSYVCPDGRSIGYIVQISKGMV